VGCGKNDKPATTNPEATKPEPTKAKATAGVKLWEFETGGSVYSSPAIGSDGTVYVGSSDNKLYAIKTDSKGLAKSPWPMRGQNPLHTGRVMKK
jgi:outer membrane protein assembly factor BamB